MKTILEIETLGHLGDGLVETDQGTVAVAYALPGEKVACHLQGKQGKIATMIRPSSSRKTPPCPHFTLCGGCCAQHMDSATYQAWKLGRLEKALQQQEIHNIDIRPLVQFPSQTRRRVAWKAMNIQGRIHLGYLQTKSHHIVNVQECPVIHKDLEDFLPPLRHLLGWVLHSHEKIEIFVTRCDQGLDVKFHFAKKKDISPDQRSVFVEFAHTQNIARLGVSDPRGDDLQLCFHTPTVSFAGVPVEVEAGAFLQATPDMDQFLENFVAEGPKRRVKRTADLFCGRGTLSFPLAKDGFVDAYEMDSAALAALESAARKAQSPVQAKARNLFTHPLTCKELRSYDRVVLDPPRSGALKQSEQLAQSDVPTILMVSCNPATFARDAKVLIQGGYSLETLQPIDQFLWSHHLEMAAKFIRV